MHSSNTIWMALVAVALTACSDSSERDTAEPTAPATTHALSAAEDCDELRERLTDSVTEAILHARYGGVEIDDKLGGKGDTGEEDDSTDDYEFQADSEIRVEEEDIVKTFGDDLFVLTDDAMLVVRRAEDGALSLVGRAGLGSHLHAAGLLVNGERAALFSSIQDGRNDTLFTGTRVTLVDLLDVTKPEVTTQYDVEGDFEMARLMGDDYYVATSSVLRASDVWQLVYDEGETLPAPEPGASEERQAELRASARQQVWGSVQARLATTENLLPRIRNNFDDPKPLVECDAVLSTTPAASVRLTNVTRFTSGDAPTTTAVVGAGLAGYAVDGNYYMAFADRWGSFAGKTRLHLFTAGEQFEYTASGLAEGALVDRYSLHADEETARIITATTGDGASVRSFSLDDDQLVQGETVATIGDEGLVVANRFTADNAFVATFGTEEKIWNIELGESDVRGPFEVGGLATMIHTLGEDRVLIVAQQTDEEERQIGVRLEIFDSAGANEPVLSDTVPTGPHSSWSEAMWDPRSLAFDAETNLVAFPVNIARWEHNNGENFSGVLVHRIGDDAVDPVAVIDHRELQVEAWCAENDQPTGCDAPGSAPWWTHVRRSVFVGGHLLTISEVGVKSHDLTELTQTGSILF